MDALNSLMDGLTNAAQPINLLYAFVGVLLGTFIGISLSLILEKTQFIKLPADVYYIDKLPVRIDFGDVGLVVFAACSIVLIATLYPAHRATHRAAEPF